MTTDDKFELWLEGVYERVKNVSCDEWEHGYKSAIVKAREKYREFKKRTQYIKSRPCEMMDCENMTEHYICDDCYSAIGKEMCEPDYGVHGDYCDACRAYPKQYYYLAGQFHSHIICLPCANKATEVRYSLKAYQDAQHDNG